MKISLPSSVSSIAQLLSTKLFTKFLGVLVLALYTRLLTKDELVVIPLFFMLTSVAVIPLNFGIYPILVKKLPYLLEHEISEGKKLFWTSAIFLTIGGFIVSLMFYLFSAHLSEFLLHDINKNTIIELTSLASFLFVIESIADRMLWATERFGKTAKIQLVTSVVRPIITISLYFSLGLSGLVFGLVLSQLLSTSMSIYYIRDYVFSGKPTFCSLKPLLQESLPFYAESFLMYFRREGDNWFVTSVLGPTTLSVYYVAKTIYTAFNSIYEAIDRVVVARYAQQYKSDFFADVIQKTNDYLVQIVIPFIFCSITLLPILILIVGGDNFKEAIYPASILLIALLISIMRIPLNRALFVATKSKFRFYMTIVESICLIVALFIFSPLFGLIGIAMSRVFAQIGGACCAIIFVRNQLKITLQYGLFILVSILSIMSLASVYLTSEMLKDQSINNLFLLPFGLIVWLSVYSFLCFLFNKDLLRTLKSLINK